MPAFDAGAFDGGAFDASGAAPPVAVTYQQPIDRGGAIANAALNLVIDPLTGDLVDAADGGFLASTDSRTAVLFQLESRFLTWWGDPFAGSRIREMLASGDDVPISGQSLRDETLRALQPLVDDGIISDLKVALDLDENGRKVVLLAYTDRTSGRPVDLAYVPFGG